MNPYLHGALKQNVCKPSDHITSNYGCQYHLQMTDAYGVMLVRVACSAMARTVSHGASQFQRAAVRKC